MKTVDATSMDGQAFDDVSSIDRSEEVRRSEEDRREETTNRLFDREQGSFASPVADCIRASFLADILFADSPELDNLNGHPVAEMQSTSLVKEWSTPQKTVTSGQPPGPEIKQPETARAEFRRQDMRVVTPMYKIDNNFVSNGELRSGLSVHREERLESKLMTDPDYKVQREQEHYRLQVIDPKADSLSNIPAHSHSLPSAYRRRNKTPDFPSAHSKRSFTKLDPLEQRRTRVKSVEVKNITPNDYLSESLERHRAMSMSPLQDKLRVNERDVNQPWDKPAHPGPRADDLRPKKKPKLRWLDQKPLTENGNFFMCRTASEMELNKPCRHQNGTLQKTVSASDLSGQDSNQSMKNGRAKSTATLKPALPPVKRLILRRQSNLTNGMAGAAKPAQKLVGSQTTRLSNCNSNDGGNRRLTPSKLVGSMAENQQDYADQYAYEQAQMHQSRRGPINTGQQKPMYEAHSVCGGSTNSNSLVRNGTGYAHGNGVGRLGAAYSRSLEDVLSSDERLTSSTPVLPRLPSQALSPQKIVYENEPVAVPIDATYGPKPDLVVCNVRQLRETFGEKSSTDGQLTQRQWSQPTSTDWAVFDVQSQQLYPLRSNTRSSTPSIRQEILLVPPELAAKQRTIVDRSAQTNQNLFGEYFQSNTHDEAIQANDDRAYYSNDDSYQRGYAAQRNDNQNGTNMEACPSPVLQQHHYHQQHQQQYQQQEQQQQQKRHESRQFKTSDRRQTTQIMTADHAQQRQPTDNSYQQQQQHQQHQQQQEQNTMNHYQRQQNDERYDPRMPRRQTDQRDIIYEQRTEYDNDWLMDSNSRAFSPTWRRQYPVEELHPDDLIRNRITRSEEVLNHDRYDINIDKRRSNFLERPVQPPSIRRLGKVWHPPPEQPYEFPHPRPPYKPHQPLGESRPFKWEPNVYEPEYKYERKNFTPQQSPPRSPPPQSSSVTPDPARRPAPMPRQQLTSTAMTSRSASAMSPLSVGGSSLALSDQISPPSRPMTNGNSGHIGDDDQFENEPTPRHPSTITVFDRPRVNIKDRISNFEKPAASGNTNNNGHQNRVVKRPPSQQNRRDYGGYQPDRNLHRSSSLDDDFLTSPISTIDRRSVHFASDGTTSGRGINIQPPPTLSDKKETEDLDELAERRQRLLERAKNRSSVNVHELRKVDVDVPPIPARDHARDLVEARLAAAGNSQLLNSLSAINNLYRNGSVSETISGELTQSQSLLTSEWEFSRQPKSRSTTNLASWQYSGFSPRSVISINGHQDDGLLRIRTDLSPSTRQTVRKANASVQTYVNEQTQPPQQQPQFWPAVLVPINAAGTPTSTLTREFKEETKRSREVERYSSMNDLDSDSRQGTLIKVQDESNRRPKSIMKNQQQQQQRRREDDRQLMVRENWGNTDRITNGGGELVQVQPKVTETVSTVEETKRTEEVERRVREHQKKERKERHSKKKRSGESGGASGHRHRESRHHHRSSSSSNVWGPRPGDADYPPWTVPFGDSPNPMWRQQAITANGHSRGGHVTESYHKNGASESRHRAEQRGSEQRSSEQRGGEHRGRNRVHKSHSSREIYHNDLPEDFEESRFRNGPIVEFPPTLPRDASGQPVRSNRQETGVHKTRSYNDWDQRSKDSAMMKKWEADIGGLERDFRDSLLMPMPPAGQNIDRREYREEAIPGGHETFSREVHAHSGSKLGNGGSTTQYNQSKQETNFRREQASNGRPY